ncbi:MAG: hypothetical protein JWN76_1941 [Chitinophagaceae bacterium]|nr:hypothetical protein [Chitinophagaceae bacterium]
MVRIKKCNKQTIALKEGNQVLTDASEIVSESFRRFFLSYAKSIKVQENRTGSLFEKNFRRKQINTDEYFTTVINYIHQNPVKHNLIRDFRDYPYSSFARIMNESKGKLMKDEVIKWFGGKQRYLDFHLQTPIDIPYLPDMEYPATPPH